MELLAQITHAIFDVNSIWSVVIKAVIWFAVALAIIIKTDSPDPQKALRGMRSTVGFFLMFLVLSGGLLYLLFGQTPV